jgi:acetyltransferase-like isoleucine patch superfamily enzyme
MNALASLARRSASSALSRGMALRTPARRARFIARAQLAARMSSSSLDIQVAADVRIGQRVRVEMRHGTTNRLVIGAGVRLRDDVLIQLSGGSITIGDHTDIRERCLLNVSGELAFEGRNILGVGTTVHCGQQILLAEMASASEYVTIVDSRHFYADPDTHFYDNSQSAPVSIGRNAWMAAKSTVLMGSKVGECTMVACHAVVSGDAPAYTVVGGAPARPLKPSLQL